LLPVPVNVTAERSDQSILIWAWAFALANPRSKTLNANKARKGVEDMPAGVRNVDVEPTREKLPRWDASGKPLGGLLSQ